MTTINNNNQPVVPFDMSALLTQVCKNKAELDASPKNINYVFGKEGVVYEVRKTPMADFCVVANNIPFADVMQEGMNWKLPKKIPFHMFLQTVSFFREVADEFAEDEAMVQIWWDKQTEEYFIVCLKQSTTKVSVRYLRDKNLELDDNKLLVMDIHSHNTMDAFWSGTDDANEKETRVYGVIGKIQREVPQYLFRYSVAGEFRAINIFDVIEQPELQIVNGSDKKFKMPESQIIMPVVDYPQEWLEIVREGKQKVTYAPVNNSRTYQGKPKNYQYGSGYAPQSQVGRPISQLSFWKGEEEPIDQFIGENDMPPFNEEESGLMHEIFVSELEPHAVSELVDEMIAYGHEDEILETLRGRGYHIELR